VLTEGKPIKIRWKMILSKPIKPIKPIKHFYEYHPANKNEPLNAEPLNL
jgi:hypothetical protein